LFETIPTGFFPISDKHLISGHRNRLYVTEYFFKRLHGSEKCSTSATSAITICFWILAHKLN